MGRKKQNKTTPAPEPAATTSLGSLLGGLGFSASQTPASEPLAAPAPSNSPLDLSASRGLKLQMERKGRRGKSVTMLEGVHDSQSADIARALRKELGCGVSVKDGVLTIQGDQSARVRAWLLSNGAPRVKGT